jgi:hypothetical protein
VGSIRKRKRKDGSTAFFAEIEHFPAKWVHLASRGQGDRVKKRVTTAAKPESMVLFMIRLRRHGMAAFREGTSTLSKVSKSGRGYYTTDGRREDFPRPSSYGRRRARFGPSPFVIGSLLVFRQRALACKRQAFDAVAMMRINSLFLTRLRDASLRIG